MSYILNQIQFNIWYDKKITARKLHTVFLKYLNHVIFFRVKIYSYGYICYNFQSSGGQMLDKTLLISYFVFFDLLF